MVKIAKIIPGGEALATLDDGKKAFFWNALPNEEILDYEITHQKSHFIRAVATKIQSESPHRISPQDSCFLSTSPWQIMDYDYELELKRELVVELFREHQISIALPEIFTDHKEYFYRNKMEYSLFWNHDTSQIELAFHLRNSHRKIPISVSSIERPEIFAAATEIVQTLNANHANAYDYQSILLRCNQNGEVSGGLFKKGEPHPTFPNLKDTILDYEYSYSPNGFFQINLPVYEMALAEIKKHIHTDEVLDLYAGVGTIGLSVARDKHLTLVECDKSAYSEMTRNVSMANGPSSEDRRLGRTPRSVSEEERFGAIDATKHVRDGNILAILAKSEEALDYITPDQTVIVDPPRAGCDIKLINRLLETTPQTIIYLSCNPATQARDIKLLSSKYHIKEIKTFNFFPRTPHIENLVILSL